MISEKVAKIFEEEGYWYDHPEHPLVDWQYEVANGDTRLGYQEWITAREDEGHET
jgi:hypothetical protein